MRYGSSRKQAFLLMLIGVILLLAFSIAQAQGERTVRIGVLDELYGPLSNGARLAVQRINDLGGVRSADGSQILLELVIQPSSAGQALDTAVAALGTQEVSAIIGPESDVAVQTNLALLQSMNIPVLVPAIGDTVLAQETSGRIFRVRAAEVWQGRALADYLITELGLNQIATAQLDFLSTAGVVGFSSAAAALGVTTAPTLLLEQEAALPDMVQQLTAGNPQAIVAYGAPAVAGDLYRALRASGWAGVFSYPGASNALFQANITPDELEDVLSTTTWSPTYTDPESTDFLLRYVRIYRAVPGELAAAGYDAVQLIAAALSLPGELAGNIDLLEEIGGTQGLLQPANLAQNDTITDVAVVGMNRFGVPLLLARYRDGQRLPEASVAVVEAVPTPEGVYVLITGIQQNVRTGPSIDFPVIGQLHTGDTAPVIGATADNTWVVIDFRGQQGWLATYLLTVVGNLDTVPIITPPATPTPAVAPSPVPPQEPDLVIDSVTFAQQPILPGTPFVANVTVRNAGFSAAGQFAVGVPVPPTNTVVSAVIAGLPAGQSVTTTVQGTVATAGFFTTAFVVDVANQVNEGSIGELNNVYNVNFVIDHPLLASGTQTLNLGDTLDLEQNAAQGDVNWNGDDGVAMDAIFGAHLAVLAPMDFNQVHFDLLNPTVITRDSIPRNELNPGTLIAIMTADGNRGVMRVDAVNDQQIVVTYKVYVP